MIIYPELVGQFESSCSLLRERLLGTPGFEFLEHPGSNPGNARIWILGTPGFESLERPGSNPWNARIRILGTPGFESLERPDSNPWNARVRILGTPGFESLERPVRIPGTPGFESLERQGSNRGYAILKQFAWLQNIVGPCIIYSQTNLSYPRIHRFCLPPGCLACLDFYPMINW